MEYAINIDECRKGSINKVALGGHYDFTTKVSLSANLPELMKIISKNGIGMDDYLDRFFNADYSSNYPPYNLIHVNNVESVLEIALAGFSKKDLRVYTEYGKLIIEGQKRVDKETGSEYVHQGLGSEKFLKGMGTFRRR